LPAQHEEYVNIAIPDGVQVKVIRVRLRDMPISDIEAISKWCKMENVETEDWPNVKKFVAPRMRRYIGGSCFFSRSHPDQPSTFEYVVASDKVMDAIASIRSAAADGGFHPGDIEAHDYQPLHIPPRKVVHGDYSYRQ
jgi:hypothetical protein